MTLLKEDGSLDVERIKRLPYKEYIIETANYSQEQIDEIYASIPLYESKRSKRAIVVDSLQEENEGGFWINAFDVVNNIV